MNLYLFNHHTKKRTHIEAFGQEPTDLALFKPKLKIDNTVNVNQLIGKLSQININTNHIKENYKFDIFYTYLFAKILTQFNYAYETYIENKKIKKKKKS